VPVAFGIPDRRLVDRAYHWVYSDERTPNTTLGNSADLVDVHVPGPDRAGMLSDVSMLAAELQVNILNVEAIGSSGGDHGKLILTVNIASARAFVNALSDRRYEPSIHSQPG
jgi:predicted amino acid-binding ACT domain protein